MTDETYAEYLTDILETCERMDISEERIDQLREMLTYPEMIYFLPENVFRKSNFSFLEKDIIFSVLFCWMNPYTAEYRSEALVLQAITDGKVQYKQLFLTREQLMAAVKSVRQYRVATEMAECEVADVLEKLVTTERIVEVDSVRFGSILYLRTDWVLQQTIVNQIRKICTAKPKMQFLARDIRKELMAYNQKTAPPLSEEQLMAVNGALTEKVSIITGGPGTGKTQIAKAILQVIKQLDRKCKVLCIAPTGMAAYNLTQVGGARAKTVHAAYYDARSKGQKYDCIIIDESSMLNLAIFRDFLSTLDWDVRIVLIGDINQLPCFDEGYLFRDILDCGIIPVFRLTQIYRQAAGSGIITAAKTIADGEIPEISSSDFEVVKYDAIHKRDLTHIVSDIIARMDELIQEGYRREDIQVLSPSREFACQLNLALQDHFNPATGIAGASFRVGDPVVFLQNKYDLGLRNGFIGTVTAVDSVGRVTVAYANGQAIQHNPKDYELLDLAYCLTVHKSQGSQYPVVIVPCFKVLGLKLLSRNLIYTAITRAQEKAILLTTDTAFAYAIARNEAAERHSVMDQLLRNEKAYEAVKHFDIDSA